MNRAAGELHEPGVDAVRWHLHLGPELDVRRRVAELAAAAVADDDDTVDDKKFVHHLHGSEHVHPS